MAQKHLHELLNEDQEPFLLKNYISERYSQLKRPTFQNTTLQVKKPKQSIRQNSTFPITLCKNACFFSFSNTPDITKSPLFEFSSSPIPSKSPCRSPNNTIFLNIPSRTATILLEAALRIQKHSKTKPHNKNNGFGLMGSLFKRLTQRNRNNKNNNNVNKVKDILSCEVDEKNMDSHKVNNNGVVVVPISEVVEGSSEVGFTCSCNGRQSSAVWSESNEEDKSMDMETSSTSGQSCCNFEEIEFLEKQKQNEEFACFDGENGFFCESPFRFVLHSSSPSSSGRRTPEFSSPAVSPTRRGIEDQESNGLNKFQAAEEEKEQFSPVSILDPPFDDDDDVHRNNYVEDGFDLECSYANVQRTRKQLLYRLCRFEKLAGLDPMELEKRMLEQEDNENDTFLEEDDCEYEDSGTSSCEENELREIVYEILCQSNICGNQQAPEDLKRLVSDLIKEEGRELNSVEERDMVIRRVFRRLELWQEVESNTIDMMILEDYSRKEYEWKKNAEQMRVLAEEVELSIFSCLLEEFYEELACCSVENFEADDDDDDELGMNDYLDSFY